MRNCISFVCNCDEVFCIYLPHPAVQIYEIRILIIEFVSISKMLDKLGIFSTAFHHKTFLTLLVTKQSGNPAFFLVNTPFVVKTVLVDVTTFSQRVQTQLNINVEEKKRSGGKMPDLYDDGDEYQ